MACLSWRLVEPPLDLRAARFEAAPDLVVDLAADINVVDGTAHALVLDGSLGGLAVGLDGDSLTAHGVVVGRGAHQEVRESDNVNGVVLAGVVLTASTLTDVVVSELSVLGRATGAATRGGLSSLLLLDGSGRLLGLRLLGLGLRLGLRLLLGGLDNGLRSRLGLGLGLRSLSSDNGSSGLRGRLGSNDLSLSSGLRRRGRGSVDAGNHSGGRSGRRSRLLLLLGSNGNGLSLGGLLNLGGSSGGLGTDPDGGGGIDHLGNVLDLSHPLNLGDDITLVVLVVTAVVDSVRVAVGLGNSRSGEEGRSKSERLHFVVVSSSVLSTKEWLYCGTSVV